MIICVKHGGGVAFISVFTAVAAVGVMFWICGGQLYSAVHSERRGGYERKEERMKSVHVQSAYIFSMDDLKINKKSI